MTEKQKEMVQKNHNLIYSFLHKHKLPLEEFYDLAGIGLCKAAILYDENRSQFSTFAYKCMYSQCIREIVTRNREKRIPEELICSINSTYETDNGNIISFEDSFSSDENIEDEAIIRTAYQEFRKNLKPEEALILDLTEKGYVLREIAEIAGCSRQRIQCQRQELLRKFKKSLS